MNRFEELFPIGAKFKSQGRTITEGDYSELHNVTWQMMGDLHSNREYMKDSEAGDMMLAGPCTLAVVMGLSNFSPFVNVLQPPGTRVLALLGLEDVHFRAPVVPGDTLLTYTEFLSVRQSEKNPKRAILKIKDTGYNQKKLVVIEITRATMVEEID